MSQLTATELYQEIEGYKWLKFHYPVEFEVNTMITKKCECCKMTHRVQQVSYFDNNLIALCPQCGNRILLDISELLKSDEKRVINRDKIKVVIIYAVLLVIVFIVAYNIL